LSTRKWLPLRKYASREAAKWVQNSKRSPREVQGE
jgi:hypothetical protein